MATFGFIMTLLLACFLTLIGLAVLTWPLGKNGIDGEKVFFILTTIALWVFVWWVCPFAVVRV